MAANRLPASWMNALDPAAGARHSRWTAARAGAPRCSEISRRSRPASGQTLIVPSAFGRGELLRRLRAPFARNVIPGAHAAGRARGRSRSRTRSFAARRRDAGAWQGLSRRSTLGFGCGTDFERSIQARTPRARLGGGPERRGRAAQRRGRFETTRRSGRRAGAHECRRDRGGGQRRRRSGLSGDQVHPDRHAVGRDPERRGWIKSLARPGGNVTGLIAFLPEMGSKRVELVKDLLPRARRVGVMTDSSPNMQSEFGHIEAAGRSLGVEVQYVRVMSSEDLDAAFTLLRKAPPDALYVQASSRVLDGLRSRIAAFGIASRLPVIGTIPYHAESGFLLSYGASIVGWHHRSAYFVDKI